MICPHCKKPIQKKKSEALRAKALKLYAEGYSYRDIQVLLEGQVTFTTVCRWVNEARK